MAKRKKSTGWSTKLSTTAYDGYANPRQPCTITISVNWQALAEELAGKAIRNKSKTANMVFGAIRSKIELTD